MIVAQCFWSVLSLFIQMPVSKKNCSWDTLYLWMTPDLRVTFKDLLAGSGHWLAWSRLIVPNPGAVFSGHLFQLTLKAEVMSSWHKGLLLKPWGSCKPHIFFIPDCIVIICVCHISSVWLDTPGQPDGKQCGHQRQSEGKRNTTVWSPYLNAMCYQIWHHIDYSFKKMTKNDQDRLCSAPWKHFIS